MPSQIFKTSYAERRNYIPFITIILVKSNLAGARTIDSFELSDNLSSFKSMFILVQELVKKVTLFLIEISACNKLINPLCNSSDETYLKVHQNT